MDRSRINYLWSCYMHDTATEAEQEELRLWLNNDGNNDGEVTFLQTLYESTQPSEAYDEQRLQILLNRIEATRKPVHKIHFLKTNWLRYAAIILLIAGTAGFLYFGNRPGEQPTHISRTNLPVITDVLPGGNKAMLTLADGSIVLLDSAAKGALASQGTTEIVKPQAGSLVYNAGTGGGEIMYNTVSTPKGGQYQVTLPDGSKAWLNAASSLRFPTSFSGKQRIVEVSGEAYFEIAKDASRPFIVRVNDASVEVLGTAFDIMAYDNEASLQTTLMQGCVKFYNKQKVVTLKPGQQSELFSSGQITVNNNVDGEMITSWKNGTQSFSSADIKTIMRKIERWYDIEIAYSGTMPSTTFSGDIPRNARLSEVLKLFKATRIDFKIDNQMKKMTVTF